MSHRQSTALTLSLLMLSVSCGGRYKDGARQTPPETPRAPWLDGDASEAETPSTPVTAYIGATVWTARGDIFSPGVLVTGDGMVLAVGDEQTPILEGAERVNVAGLHITPGLIDTHSHMGVYSSPHVGATSDVNETTSPNTAEVWAADSFWPQDPARMRALAGGVTTFQVLPGSANLFGGRGAILRNRPGARAVRELLFEGAPRTFKMACGENPKRAYGVDRKSAPLTRMGSVAKYREAFQKAVEHRRDWSVFEKKHKEWAKKGEGDEPQPPSRDHQLETLVGVLEGKVLVQMHCYRADEMARMLEIADEFGFKIRSFHHAVEAYKIRDLLRQHDVSVSTWPDWWGFKLEAYDAIPENLALLSRDGVISILHSDSSSMIQRLGQEAGKARAFGLRQQIAISEDEAIRWVTANAAWALGISDMVGSLAPGMYADFVIWDGSPLSVYSRPQRVFIDAEQVFDRATTPSSQLSDFELGVLP